MLQTARRKHNLGKSPARFLGGGVEYPIVNGVDSQWQIDRQQGGVTLKRKKSWRIILISIVCLIVFLSLGNYFLQKYWAHRKGYFDPDYPRVELTEDTDYETIFLQTGLGKSAFDRLRSEGNFQAVLEAQDLFFNPPKRNCIPLFGWFTREDRMEHAGPAMADLQPGDIIVSLATHSLSWYHGHSGLVIDPGTTLECALVGTNSDCFSIGHWTTYTNYAVLRLKNADPALGQQIAEYGLTTLRGVPYHLTSGFLGPKAPDPDDWQFGLHCSYLVWYAYQHFGYDLDSDGGRLVTTYDLLHSDLLEVVQIYGMDPRQFLSAADLPSNEETTAVYRQRYATAVSDWDQRIYLTAFSS